jgi:hypothetical protein
MDNKTYKMLVVYHSADMDGLMSGAIAKMAMNIIRSELLLDVDFAGYNYGIDPQKDKWLDFEKNGYDHYQFIDITPPLAWLEGISDLINVRNEVVSWVPVIHMFDHHKGVLDNFMESESAYRLLGGEGLYPCVLRYFFSGVESGAMIYLNSLTENGFWIDELIDGLSIQKYKQTGLQRIFPKMRARKEIRERTEKWLTNEYVFDLVKLVTKYDTWRWYPEWKVESASWQAKVPNEYTSMKPLALNQWFYGLSKEDFNMEFVVDQFFFGNNGEGIKGKWKPSYENKLISGFAKIAENFKVAKNKGYSYVIFNGTRVCLVHGSLSFFESEHVMSLKTEAEKAPTEENYMIRSCEVLMSYKIDFTDMICKYSFRQIGVPFDCAKFAAAVGKDNGGGHEGAAGCRTSFADFYAGLQKWGISA